MKKKITKKKKLDTSKWLELPQKDWKVWFGEWMIANIVMESWKKTGKIPMRIKVPKQCITELPDGSGQLHVEVDY